ncbi:hypothetical protein HKT18_05220 [Flavobacterium sp. IMCC34852]|uniref:Metal-dependent HD superfamily phosphohydrolase n=1 Tax=Flavobacterium rivulicola TaxID=2732161 RepID=A0A7Y3R7Z3_9FLAO|nr:hypothetical protein [Flavobacterium sp. IMCC34852]NNT71615.1 hypothetical protein [Flavobacterium sp. IMCC34852]
MLTDTFLQLVNKYSNNNELATNLWLEIFTKYSDPKRQYHTIDHLEAIIVDLTEIKDKIEDWDTTLLAVFYHDIIYKASSSTNEGDSAKLAMQKLSEIGYPAEKIAKCANMILATKLHEISQDNDTNYFIDADLAILGRGQYEYQKYTEQIREEYSIYPDFMYNNGRKKALQHFLQMDAIYKTDYFFEKYEKQARLNISNELETL